VTDLQRAQQGELGFTHRFDFDSKVLAAQEQVAWAIAQLQTLVARVRLNREPPDLLYGKRGPKQPHRGREQEAQAVVMRLVHFFKATQIERPAVGFVERLFDQPFEARDIGQVGELACDRMSTQKIGEARALLADIAGARAAAAAIFTTQMRKAAAPDEALDRRVDGRERAGVVLEHVVAIDAEPQRGANAGGT